MITMKSVYSISPVIYTDRLPDKATVEYVISKYFFLFQVYHESKEMVMLYMDYIDKWFDNAFSNMNLRIVQYDYPDYINYGSGQMADYINETYDLSNDNQLAVEHELSIQYGKHFLYGDFEVMFNGYSSYELNQSAMGLFEGDNLSDAVMFIARYLRYDLRRLLCEMVKALYEYDEAFQDLDQADYYHFDVFQNPYIDDNYAIYYEMRKFIELERRYA